MFKQFHHDGYEEFRSFHAAIQQVLDWTKEVNWKVRQVDGEYLPAITSEPDINALYCIEYMKSIYSGIWIAIFRIAIQDRKSMVLFKLTWGG